MTFPVNIAAPSFSFCAPAEEVELEVGISGMEPAIFVSADTADIVPPLDEWHELLDAAQGKQIYLRIRALEDGQWTGYKDVIAEVSKDSIDSYLVYRLVYPGYELWGEMGIYQRDLSSYEETAVIRNTDISDKTCVNCHNFAAGDVQKMMMHVRGPIGGTMLIRGEDIRKINPAAHPVGGDLPNGATYPSSEKSGRFIAFSSNNVQQFFHSDGRKLIEVSDMASDLFVFDTQTGDAITSPDISGDEWMETFPTWSEDGLYFCRAKAYKEAMPLDSIRYDLCFVSFDQTTLQFGKPEVIYSPSAEGHSCSFPRVSPDGRWLLFTQSDYGNFSIWHPEADLYLMNLADRSIRRCDELNSDNTESYHSWSKDGRWVVFSSRRIDGNWTRPYLAHFDAATGTFGKPFLLPQETTDYYLQLMQSFNVPEFTTAPITIRKSLLEAIRIEE